MRAFRLGLSLVSLLAVAGCTCDVPRFSCSNDLQCPDTYSCVSGVCEPCPSCGDGERCSAGACIPAVNALRFAFTSAPQTVAVGSCSGEVRFEVQDTALGTPAVVEADVAVALAASNTTLAFFSDAACGSPLAGLTLPAGSGSAGFYFRDTAIGAPELGVSATGFDPARQVQAVTVGPPARLTFLTPAQSIAAGACSAVASFQVQDGLGNPSAVPADTAVALSSTTATLTFYADPGCGTAITQLTLPTGATQGDFYFRDSAVGAPLVTATAAFGAASQQETITGAALTALAFTTPSRTIAAGSCSPALTVQAQDALGNPSVVQSALPVSLTSSSTTLVFHADANCTSATTSISIAPGASSASFYFTDTVAGVPSVTAASTGLSSAIQSQAVTASLPSSIAITTPSQTVTTGDCSAAVRVEARDAQGNPSAVPAAESLSLSSAATMTFYSDAACTTVISSATIALGASSTTFYFRDTGTGGRTIAVTSTTLGATSQNETIIASVGRLAFTTGAQTRAAGACSGVVTVQSQDAGGAPQNVGVALVVSITSTSGSMAFYSDSGCTTAVSSITIAAATNAQDFYFRDTATGTPTITVNASGYSQAAQPATITAGAPSRLAFITAAQSQSAGACSSVVTVQTRDSFDNPSSVVGTTPLTLSSTSGTMAFFSDAACATAINGLTLAAGLSQGSFFFRDGTAGTPTITVGGGGLSTANQVETITAGGATQLVFLTAPQTLVAGACSALTTVQTRDAQGNPAAMAAATAVTLSATSGTLRFFSDSACTTQVTQVTIAAAASSAGFYFSDTAAGTAQLTAASAPLTPATQSASFTAGPPARLAFTTPAQSLADNTCSAVVTVQTRDANGNPSNVTAATVVGLTSTSGTMGFFSDGACTVAVTDVTIAAATNQGSFYFRDTAAGTPTITAASAPLTSANQQETITVVPKRLAFTTAAQTILAGACSGITTIQSQDTAGAPLVVTVATPVNLSASIGTLQLFSDNTCNTPLAQVVINAGQSLRSFYWRDTTAGSMVLTASASGYAGATQTQTLNAGAVVAFGFATPPATVPVNTCSPAVTVWPVDQYGNPGRTNNTVTVTSSSGSMQFFTNSGCTTPLTSLNFTPGTVSRDFYFRDTTTGSPVVTLNASGLTPGTQTETIIPGPPSRLVFSTPAQSILAGNCSAAATVTLQDAFANVAVASAATVVNLVSAPNSLLFYSNAACTTQVSSVTIAAGASTGTFYFRDTVAGSRAVTASSAGLTSANQTEVINPAPPSKIAFTTAPQTRAAGACSGIATLRTQDPFDNISNVSAVTVANLSASTGSMVFYSDATCATAITSVSFPANSSQRDFYFRETLAGTTTITATASGLTPGSQPETITPGAPAKLTYVTPPQTVLENFCSAVTTVQTQDTFNNPSPVAAVHNLALSSSSGTLVFYSDASCTTQVASVSVPAAGTNASFYFRDTSVGTPTVVATSATLGAATQIETINPAIPTKVVMITPARTVAAGGCSQVVTVQAQNNNNVASNVTADTTATLSSTAGTTFYTDSGCTTAVTSITILAGTNSQNFYFRDTVAGSPVLTATPPLLTPGAQTQVVTPASAFSLHFTSAPVTVTAGVCSPLVRLQVRDSFGNDTTVGANTVVALSSAPSTLTWFTDSGCTATTSQVTIAGGSGLQNVYFRATVSGATTASGTASGLVAASQNETVNPAAPSVLAITSPVQSITAGACSAAVTLRTRDTYGNNSNVGSSTLVSLSGGASMAFFTDAACATPVTQVTVAAATSTATFYFRDNVAGARTLTATAGGFSPASQGATIDPGTATRLVYLTGPQSLTAGTCSARVDVQTQDALSNPSNVGAVTAVALSPSTGTVTFYSDAGCTTAITSLSFAAGSNLRSFYFRGTQVGSPTVTASAAGFTSAVQTETISANTAVNLVFTNAPINVGVGLCSSAATVRTQDAYGNFSNVTGATTVNLASNPAILTFYSDAGCASAVTSRSIPAGQSTATFYFRSSTAGTPQVTASASGFTSAQQVETVSAGGPTVLAFTTSPQVLVAGNCSGITTLQTRDSFGNPSNVASATTVTLSALTATFYADAGCATPVTSVVVPAGGNQVSFYFRETVSGNRDLTASASGFTSGVQTELINPAAAAALVFTNAPITLAAGACSPALTLQARDAFGNNTTVGGNTNVALSSAPATLSWFTDAGCSSGTTAVTIAAGSGTQTVYFRATTAGATTATGTASGLTAANQGETINPASPTVLALTSAPQSINAGSCSAPVTLRTRDTFGNNSNVSSNLTVGLAGGASMAFFTDAGCTSSTSSVTVPAGSSTATFYFRDNVAGARTLTASATGYSSGNQGATINPAAPSKLVYLTGPQTLLAGNCSARVDVQTQDPFNNPSGVPSLTAVPLTPSSGTVTFYSDAGCSSAITQLSFAAGANLRSFYFRGTLVGAPTITASATGLTSAVQTETINPNTAVTLVFTSAPITVGTGVCSPAATVRTQDAYGNFAPVSANAVVGLASNPPTLTFYSDPSCTSAVTSRTITTGQSTTTFHFRTNTAGTPQVTASATGYTSAQQTETVSAGGPTVLVFTTAPQSVTAGGCSGITTLQTRDAFGNPSNVAANTTVNLAGLSMSFFTGPGCTGATSSVVVPAGGNTASFYFRDNTAGSRDITASSTGYASAQQTETINPAAAAALVFTNAPLSISAGGCSTAASLQARDAFGNDTTVGSNTNVALSSNTGTLSWYADSGCNTLTSSVTISAGSGTQSAYFRATVAGTPTATATALGLTQATQVEQVNPASATVLGFTTNPQTVIAGGCSGITTVQTRDVYGNASNVGSNTAVAPSGATMTFFSDPGCSAPVGSVTVPAGNSTASFYFRDTVSGQRVLSVSSAGFTGANQTQTVNPAAPNKLAFTTTAQTLLASACSGVTTVQTRDTFDNPTTAGATVNLTAGATPADLATAFYSDSSCTTSATSVTIPAGQSAGSFYFKGRTAGTATLTAQATGLTSTNQGQTLVATVRTGLCSIGVGASSTTCGITPALFNTDRTIVFFGASGTGAAADEVNVRCLLTNATTITCDRAGTATSVSIRWHTVEFPAGPGYPLVRHINQPCGGATTTATITPALAGTGNAFVLLSSTRSSGTGQTVASSRTAKITATNQVTVEYNSGGCGGDLYGLQVVEYPGANVTTGTLSLASGAVNVTSAVLSAVDLSRTFLLVSSRSGDDPVCARAVRGRLANATQVIASRGCTGSVVDEIHFQRVELPAGNSVQSVGFSLAAAATSASQAITAVDTTRTAMFSAGQMTSGQAWGETTNASESFTEAVARHTLASATSAQIDRGTAVSSAAFTAFVVQWSP